MYEIITQVIAAIQPMVIKLVTTGVTAEAVTAFKQMNEELEAVETMHRNGDVIVLLLIEGMG